MLNQNKIIPNLFLRAYPLVLIQSENSKDDNLRTLFPPELRQALNIVHIQMNGVAITNLVCMKISPHKF